MSNVNQASPPMLFGPAILGALNATLVVQDVDYVCLQFSTGLVGTVLFEQSNDSVTWDTVRVTALASASNTGLVSITNPTAVLYSSPVQGKYFRVRVSAYTSGSCTVIAACYEGILAPFAVTVGNIVSTTTSPSAGDLPSTATFKSNASGNVAAAAANCTIAAPGAGITTWITGFEITGAGATAASIILVTLTNILGGTWTWCLVIPAGVTTDIGRFAVEFSKPIPASGPNVAVALNVPSFGAGNTNAAAIIHGYAV